MERVYSSTRASHALPITYVTFDNILHAHMRTSLHARTSRYVHQVSEFHAAIESWLKKMDEKEAVAVE